MAAPVERGLHGRRQRSGPESAREAPQTLPLLDRKNMNNNE
jgi:hypothetical protein